ncbi:G-protein coupled receptor Mth2-like [Zerene cesonia]|uniref:G-protein coupled receptor Mth2-like n=1 Tax=Zerene cesonia TaxID=33412 RepID=UPI0018E56E75|nr:G-protein coupled receptor Mth2-like [Zerene cesonia]
MFEQSYCYKFYITLAFCLASVNCYSTESTCCTEEKGILMDGLDYCEHPTDGTYTPLDLDCNTTEHYFLSYLNISLAEDGSLEMTNDANIRISAGRFCIADRTVNDSEAMLVLCNDNVEEANGNNAYISYCMLVSVVFLFLTAIVYCILPELRDMQGKSIINFCISLSFALCLFSVSNLVIAENMMSCTIQTFFIYFFFMASFFWTNAISIQIFQAVRRPVLLDYGWKKFFFYALYAWGCPVLLTMCMAIVNFHPGNHHKPGIGIYTCWFRDKYQQWYYMYSVMLIILLVNFALFIYTCICLWRQSFSSTNIKAMKYKTAMMLKLCIVMGLPWIFEMISTLTHPHIIWTILDIFNVLQGPLLFLILVVFRRRTIKALYKKGYLDCISGMVEKHLAVAEDDEDVVEHTTGIALEVK